MGDELKDPRVAQVYVTLQAETQLSGEVSLRVAQKIVDHLDLLAEKREEYELCFVERGL